MKKLVELIKNIIESIKGPVISQIQYGRLTLFVHYHIYYYIYNVVFLVIVWIICNIVLNMSNDASFLKSISNKHAGVPDVKVQDLNRMIGPVFPIIENVSIFDYQPDGREIPPIKSLNPKAHTIDNEIIFTPEYLEKDRIEQWNDNIDLRWVLIDVLKGQVGVDPGTNKEIYGFKAYILKAPTEEIASKTYNRYLTLGDNLWIKNLNSAITNLDEKQPRWELIELKELVYIPNEEMYHPSINMLCYTSVGWADIFNKKLGVDKNGKEAFDLGVRYFFPVGISGHVSENSIIKFDTKFNTSTMQIVNAVPKKEEFFIFRIISLDTLSVVSPGYISPPIRNVFEHWVDKFLEKKKK